MPSPNRELDLSFHSFCTIHTGVASDATSAEFNPFDEGSYATGGTYTHTVSSSPDITYDKSTGTITFGAQGSYFVISSLQAGSNSGNGTAVGKLKLNGEAFLTSDAVKVFANFDPRPLTMHAVINVEQGDEFTATFDGTMAGGGTAKGSFITVLKCNGHFSSAYYTTKADDTSTASSYHLYDTTNEGGVVSSNVNGITYAGSTGRFTTSATRTFLMFSTWILDSGGTVSDFFHKININGSTLDELTCGSTTAATPECHSYHAIKSVTGGEYIAINFDQGGTETFTAEIGTSFSIVDISEDGNNPSAMLSFTITNDSNAMATDSGDKDIFDEDNYSSYAFTNHVTATNITYTQADGKFTIVEDGHYLVLLTVGLDSTSNGTPTLKLNKNGSTYYDAAIDLRANSDPRSQPLCLVMPLVKDDYLNFLVNNAGADFDDGSSVSIFKIDEIADLHPRSDPTEDLISDDLIINNYTVDNLGVQHDRTVQKQVPFILGTRSTTRLRGRRPFGDTTGKGVSTDPGGKKN